MNSVASRALRFLYGTFPYILAFGHRRNAKISRRGIFRVRMKRLVDEFIDDSLIEIFSITFCLLCISCNARFPHIYLHIF